MYGFTQAGRLENYPLTEYLTPKGYLQITNTPGLWRQKRHPKLFYLGVDESKVKYAGKEHADHLITAIREFYPFAEDWN